MEIKKNIFYNKNNILLHRTETESMTQDFCKWNNSSWIWLFKKDSSAENGICNGERNIAGEKEATSVRPLVIEGRMITQIILHWSPPD
jgi:hypothetical protein